MCVYIVNCVFELLYENNGSINKLMGYFRYFLRKILYHSFGHMNACTRINNTQYIGRDFFVVVLRTGVRGVPSPYH